MFGINAIAVITTRTGVSDRAYLSVEKTNLNSFFKFQAFYVSCGNVFDFGKCERKKKITSVSQYFNAFFSRFLYFSISHPQFGKCVFCTADFFQSAGLKKKKKEKKGNI